MPRRRRPGPGFRTEIRRALGFIDANLERPLTLEEVAGAAHLSPFHFHRVFHAIVGEPLGRYLTRRRLEQAALRLAYETDRSITDIALSSGYSSSSNFSKAFAAYFGCSPTEVRRPTGHVSPAFGRLAREYGRDLRATNLRAVPSGMDPKQQEREAEEWEARLRFEDSPGLSFACLAGPEGYDLQSLLQTWNELIRFGRQLGLCGESVDAWGVAHDSPQITAPELCRYHACIPCPIDHPLPAPLFHDALLPGRYAVFRYEGEVSAIEAAYRSIYACCFTRSTLAPDDLRPFERYITDEPQDGHVSLEFWFKVRPRR